MRFAKHMKNPSRRRLSRAPSAQCSSPYRSEANTADPRNLPFKRAGTDLLRKTRLLRRSTTDSAQQILCFIAGDYFDNITKYDEQRIPDKKNFLIK